MPITIPCINAGKTKTNYQKGMIVLSLFPRFAQTTRSAIQEFLPLTSKTIFRKVLFLELNASLLFDSTALLLDCYTLLCAKVEG